MFKKYNYLIILILLSAACVSYRALRAPSEEKLQKQYVIIGCSAAGYSAAKELIKSELNSHVMCFSDEKSYSYNKPAFHNYISKNNIKKIDLVKEKKSGLDIILNSEIIAIDPNKKIIIDNKNNSYSYDKLLIATGEKPLVQ